MIRRIGAAVLILLWSLALAAGAWAAAPEALVPVGQTVGLELEAEGVYVAAFDRETENSPAQQAGLRLGDRILTVDGSSLENAGRLGELVEAGEGRPMVLGIRRGGRDMSFTLRPRQQEGRWRLGLWVRDRVAGLGTLTFYEPHSGVFGALGHGVNGADGGLLPLRGGAASRTSVSGIKKGEAGAPGSLLGAPEGGPLLGLVEENSERGLFGHTVGPLQAGTALPLAAREEVQVGQAEILSNVAGQRTERYAVEIKGVSFDPDGFRDLELRVTDPRLLEATGGIVQGMSGSPILQNGKLVGAVTHVLVRDPTRGYGILIGHMWEAWEDSQQPEAP